MTLTTSGATSSPPSWATAPHGPQARAGAPALSRALGLASLALGAWQLLAPRDVARTTGLTPPRLSPRTDGLPLDAETLVRAVGVRELAVVPGLLAGGGAGGWLWARVAGDAMDLLLVRRALDGATGRRRERLLATAAVLAGITATDLLAARRAQRRAEPLHLTAAVTVAVPEQQAYEFWRDLTNLPRFMTHLEEVTVQGDRSRWTARAPIGSVSWDAETTADEPGRRIAWRSVGRTAVPNEGEVVFSPAPGGRGTEVRVHLDYALPGGRAGGAVARALGEDPHQQVEDDLRRFKQVMETGDVVYSDGSPEGTRARRHAFQSPGQPTPSSSRRS